MDKLNLIIAENLKKLREERHLSLENTSQLTGVSKSMIGQIERGEVNPTISTIWKIANGFKISFTELMSTSRSDVERVSRDQIVPLVNEDGKLLNYPMFLFESNRRFEIYSVDIEPGGDLDATAHPSGTREFIMVYDGEVTITVSGTRHRVVANDAISIRADVAHGYENTGKSLCRLCMVIHYPETK